MSASGGVGGKGIIPGRERDTFGVGYFHLKFQPDRLTDFTGADDESQGFEAFYNVSITPAANLTLDVQVLDSPLPDVDMPVQKEIETFLGRARERERAVLRFVERELRAFPIASPAPGAADLGPAGALRAGAARCGRAPGVALALRPA